MTCLISYEVTVAAYILKLYCNTQAFIQAPLSTAVFRFQFLFWLLSSVALWVGLIVETEWKSVDCCKIHFSWILFIYLFSYFLNFRVLLRVVKKSLLERHLQTSFMHVTKDKKNRSMQWKIFQGLFKNKKEKKIQLEFCNSIQDWVFTNVYQLEKCLT